MTLAQQDRELTSDEGAYPLRCNLRLAHGCLFLS
jgi:hypothetical protein